MTTKHQAPPVTIAYLVKGFFDQLHRINHGDKSLGELSATPSGEWEAVERLTEYADMVEQLWQERFSGTDEWGGVWDYDVTERFGEAIASCLIAEHKLLDDTRAKQLLTTIVENELENWQ